MEYAELVPDLIGTYEVTDMESKRIMLQTWNQSAGVMHIAHHLAAARYAGRHRIFGSFTAAMSALVSASAFAALQQQQELSWLLITGFLSITASMCTAINTFIGHDGRAKQHHHAATLFQSLRREIEEDIAFFDERKDRSDYSTLRGRWSEALEVSPPVPQDIHDEVKNDKHGKYQETQPS